MSYRFPYESQGPACPGCQGPLVRVHRLLGDRLLGMFLPAEPVRHRYECRSWLCGWQGCLASPPRRVV